MWPTNSANPVLNGAAALIVAALVILALYVGRDLLIPLALAGLLSFILHPLVRRLDNWGVPQGLAVILVVSALIASLLGGIALAGRQVAQLLEEVPRHETNLRAKARTVHVLLGGSGIWQRAIETLHNVEQEVHDPEAEAKPLKIEVAQDRSLSVLFEYTRSTLPSIVTAGLSIIMTIFILLQYDELRDRIVRLMGVSEIGRSTQALNDVGDDVAIFFLLQTGLNISFGIFIAAALWLIGVPSPALWGVTAAIMRFVPYVGSVISGIFPIVLAAMVDSSWWMLVDSAAVFVGGDLIVGQFVEPLLFGSRTHLSSIAVVCGVAFWTLLWGPVGLILAVPLTLTIVVIGQHVPHLEFLRILLGNEPVLKPHQKLYRQLLVGDVTEAAKEAGRWIEKKGYIKYLDEAAMASLEMASDDRKRGILGKEQLDALKDVLPEYIAQVEEALDFKHEQENARDGERKKVSSNETATAVVIAGRGVIDQAAAELVTGAIRSELGISAECPSLGGLTGITAARRARDEAPPDVVAIISVGEVTRAQLVLLINRAKRVFEESAIAVGYWGGPKIGDSLQREIHGSSIFATGTVGELVDSISRIASERLTNSRRSPPIAIEVSQPESAQP